MTEELREITGSIIYELYGVKFTPEFVRTDPKNGDFTTNAAMQLAGRVAKPPREIADSITALLKEREKIEADAAGPGFINIRLSDEMVFSAALGSTDIVQPLAGQVIVAEYSDPNPFKVLHAGHLYTSLVGDAIANIMQAAGGQVHRVNFGGDVGLHVAKTMWAIIAELGGEFPEKLGDIDNLEKLDWVSKRYVHGNDAYDNDPAAKEEITSINKKVYAVHAEDDRDSPFARIYWTCRQWSYDGFDALYDRLGMVPFEKYYPESVTTALGVATVREGLEKGIFTESDGAIIYPGEEKGLHTRVFINSEGLPTYEAKDLGLSLTKWQDYAFDKSFIITGNDIEQYMKVVIAAVGDFNADAAARTRHLTHGQIKLSGGVKMSSRQGNILRADDILDAAFETAKSASGKEDSDVVLGAVRYSFLRSRIGGGDIIYDPSESVSLEGNSGPYLQYALVRARSILRKVEDITPDRETAHLDELERSLARQISIYPEAFAASLAEYSPHVICGYLYELAVTFNRFYEKSRVIGSDRAGVRVSLVKAYEQTLTHGLSVLGMPRPEKM